MALNRGSIHDRELNKFVESPSRPGEPAVEIVGNLSASIAPGPFDPPTATDTILRSVLANVETYEYKSGGPSGTLLKTVTVTYLTSSLKDLVSVVVS